MKFGLEEQVIENIITVLEQYPKVDKAFVFGSRAKGNYRPDSDIDIAIKGYEITTDDIIAISVAIETKGVTYKFDLLDYNGIKELALKEHIDRVGVEFYSRWKEYRFSELLIDESISYGIVKPGTHTEIDSVPIIRVNNIKNGHIITDEIMKVSSSIEEKYLRTRLIGGELLITVVGSVGECAIVPENLKGWNVARAVSVARIKKEFDVQFIKYAFKTDDLIFQMYGNTNDTVQPTLNLSLLKELKFKLPSLPEQTAIASILSSLDDKIDLLNRQNKTLEQLAETLFRQWFVEEAEESWDEICLSEIAIHSKESVNPSKSPNKLYKHFSLPAFDQGKEPIIEIGKDILSNKYKVVSNSILVSKLNPRTPRIWMLIGDINENECICSTEFQIVKPKNIEWFGFVYCFLKSNQVTQELGGASSGTSGSHQRVNPQDIFNLSFSKPPLSFVQEFSKRTNQFWIKIQNNQTQIRTLTRTRDTLLPKLMSGELKITISN